MVSRRTGYQNPEAARLDGSSRRKKSRESLNSEVLVKTWGDAGRVMLVGGVSGMWTPFSEGPTLRAKCDLISSLFCRQGN